MAKPQVSGQERGARRPAAKASRVSEAAKLDGVIHERMRLAILCALAVNETLSFNALKGLLGATGGNLSVHARKLEEAGYVSCVKGFLGRVQHTDYRITTAGRRALDKYLAHMEALIRATKG